MSPGISGLAALMDRYLDGDERAFVLLHAAVTPRLRGLLHKLVRDSATAEDLLQATLLKAHLARDGFVVRGSHADAAVQAWYATIARNLALDTLRHERHSPINAVTDLSRLIVLAGIMQLKAR